MSSGIKIQSGVFWYPDLGLVKDNGQTINVYTADMCGSDIKVGDEIYYPVVEHLIEDYATIRFGTVIEILPPRRHHIASRDVFWACQLKVRNRENGKIEIHDFPDNVMVI